MSSPKRLYRYGKSFEIIIVIVVSVIMGGVCIVESRSWKNIYFNYRVQYNTYS